VAVHVPRIRLIAIDLDGTLLNDAKKVSDHTARALADLGKRGIRVVIASARPPRSVRHIYSTLGLDTFQINYNGALIWDEPTKRAVFHRPLAGNLVRAIVNEARRQHDAVLVSCEVMDRWFTDRVDQKYTTETGRLFSPDVIAPLDEMCRQEITKLMLLAEKDVLARLNEFILASFPGQVVTVQTDDTLLQIMHPRVGKSAALQMVLTHYKIPPVEMMAIGDAPNDVGMLQMAGVAVAMDNAYAIVKKVSHWVAPSNNDQGVYAALRKYGLAE